MKRVLQYCVRHPKQVVLLAMVSAGFAVLLPCGTVHAVTGTGYFDGGLHTAFSADDVLPGRASGGAVPGWVYDGIGNDKEEFIAWIASFTPRDTLATGQQQTGGAFIVNTMTGQGAPNRWTPTAMFNDFMQRIRSPNVIMYTTTDDPNNYGNGQISFYSNDINDDFFTTYNSSARDLLIFRDTALNVLYVIEIPCANPVGGLSLPPGNNLPIGAFDGVDCNYVSGWGFDWDAPWGSLQYAVYVNGVQNGPYPTSQDRPDVNGAYGIVGVHGYAIATNTLSGFNPLAVNTVEVAIFDINTGERVGLGTRNVGPCNAATCVLPSNFPTIMSVGQTYYLKPQVRLNYAWGWPYHTGPTGADYDPTMHVTVLNPSNVPVYDSDVKYDAGWPVAGTTLTANPTNTSGDPGIPFTPTASGTYRLQWSIRGQLSVTCPAAGSYETGDAGFSPFFTVTGGDILSGAGIRGWNFDGSGGSYTGAGTNIAAIAAGDIQSFVTGTGLPGGAATNTGAGLAFANTPRPAGTYGGGFTVAAFTPTIPASTTAWGSSTLNLGDPALTDGTTYTYGGDLTITGQLPTGKNITIVLTSGNAIIGGNLTYGSYTSPADIPRLTLLVQSGNIYVDRSVSEMHGVFYAGGSGANGNFYSCANGVTPVAMNASGAYDACFGRLVVYGAVAANQLVLSRTYGNLTAAPGVPVVAAEDFYYSPELWLAQPGTGSSGSTSGTYDSYVALPPIL